MDICHKVIRTDTVLDFINDIKNKARGDPREEINRALQGTTVMTTYNKRTYRVEDINFEISMKDTFPQEDGTEISYLEYFRQKYGKEIRDVN